MAELRSEEEQLDAIKQWWKRNGTSLIAGVALAAAGVFGWNAWQDYQANQAEAASMRYQQLLSLSGEESLDEPARRRANELVVEIIDEHGDTLYADLARLIDARLAVGQSDHAAARDSLQAVVDGSSRDFLQGIARLRLARLQVAEGDPEAALTTLEAGVPEALAAQSAEVRGDAHHAMGRQEDARAAWQEALSLANQHNRPLYGVDLKLANLGHDEATL